MPEKAIAICGNPRTGGNWLCKLLCEAELGLPDEYISRRIAAPLIREWGIAEEDYWPTLWEKKSPKGIFAIKIHWRELRRKSLNFNPLAVLPPESKKYWIFQTRDYRQQAISWAQAVRTGVWFGKTPPATATEAEIKKFMPPCRSYTINWQIWFTKNGIEPLVIPYEKFKADPDSYVDQIKAMVNG